MAGKRPLAVPKGPSMLFSMPNIVGRRYNPGWQPNSPGESSSNWPGAVFGPIPWPNVVPSIVALANHPGIPRNRPQGITNNATSPLLENWLFIANLQKARG